jgi:hypothetical protein
MADDLGRKPEPFIRQPAAVTIVDAAPPHPPPFTAAATAELNAAISHLHGVLGEQTYESVARNGEKMTIAAIAKYACDQIDQARAELNAVSR